MNRIFLLADLHGSYKPIRDLNVRLIKKLDKTDTIIILGDAGLNFFLNKSDDNLKQQLGKYKCNYFIIRGNHEERPSNLLIKDKDANWHIGEQWRNFIFYEEKYPYIKYAMDFPTVYYINNYKTLVLPGAYSVDKEYRLKMGWSWFEDEQLTEKEMEHGREIAKQHNFSFDLVLSHTCPIIYEPTDLFLSFVDQSKVDKTMERYLGELEHALDYRLWCWGHYHKYRVYPLNEGRQPLMLYNDAAIELNEWMLALPSQIGKTY
jgi:3-oxoacid CoA-transferase subunit A